MGIGTYREHDPLVELLLREHGRVLQCVMRYASGESPARALGEARGVLRSLAVIEETVLYPALTRVSLRPETQRLLDDCRDNRVRQCEVLDALAHKRSPRLRKLKAAELSDLIHQHAEQHVELLIPVLRSQMPRVMYRSVFHAFETRYSEQIHPTTPTPERTTPEAVSQSPQSPQSPQSHHARHSHQ